MPRATSTTSSNVTSSRTAIAASGSTSCPCTTVWVAAWRATALVFSNASTRRPAAYARALAAQLVDDLAHPRVRLDALAGLEPGRQLKDRDVGERVVDRVDRVRQAALLADLVEQARAHRAAQQRPVDGQRGAVALVARVDRRAVGDAQVRLVGVALLDQRLRRESRRRLVAAVGLDRGEAPERLDQLLVLGYVLEIADQERAAARAGPLAPAEREDGLAAERAQVLLGAQHRASQRVVAERGAVDEVLGHHRRLVVGARDLLDHDAALPVELFLVDLGPADEVGEEVDRLADHLRARRDVERDEVVRRVRVQDAAHPLGGLVDLAVVGVLLAALEHEVLEEVRHPVLLLALGPRAGLEGHENGHRAGAGQVDPVERQPVGKGGGVDLRHGLDGTVSRAIPLAGRGAGRRDEYPPGPPWLPLNVTSDAARSRVHRASGWSATPCRAPSWTSAP